jgi:hypothetical protein
MYKKGIKIELYNKGEKSSSVIEVDKIRENMFKMNVNDLINPRLTFGTIFETVINKEGQHELKRIIEESGFITRRFTLTSQFKESEYKLLGDEISKHGGFWQVDFGQFATLNLPKDFNLDIDEILRIFDFKGIEIKD